MSDNTTQPDSQKPAEECADRDVDPVLDPDSERNATPDGNPPATPEVEVSPATVAELHRRLLDVDNTVTDAETHITAVSELVGAESIDSGSKSASVSAELDATITKLEEIADRIDEAISGARELQKSAKTTSGPSGDEGKNDTDSQRSMFDQDGYVRNTADDRSDQHNI